LGDLLPKSIATILAGLISIEVVILISVYLCSSSCFYQGVYVIDLNLLVFVVLTGYLSSVESFFLRDSFGAV